MIFWSELSFLLGHQVEEKMVLLTALDSAMHAFNVKKLLLIAAIELEEPGIFHLP